MRMQRALAAMGGRPARVVTNAAEVAGADAPTDDASAAANSSAAPVRTVADVFASMMSSAGRNAMARAATAASHESGKPVGRNDLCPCGSGKKYKKCCGRNLI